MLSKKIKYYFDLQAHGVLCTTKKSSVIREELITLIDNFFSNRHLAKSKTSTLTTVSLRTRTIYAVPHPP